MRSESVRTEQFHLFDFAVISSINLIKLRFVKFKQNIKKSLKNDTLLKIYFTKDTLANRVCGPRR